MQIRDGISFELWLTVLSVGFSHIFPMDFKSHRSLVYENDPNHIHVISINLDRKAGKEEEAHCEVRQSEGFEVKSHFLVVVESSDKAQFLITVMWCQTRLDGVFQPVAQWTMGYGLKFPRSVWNNADEHLYSKLKIENTDEISEINVSRVLHFPINSVACHY